MTESLATLADLSFFRVATLPIPVFHHDMRRLLFLHVFGALLTTMANGATNFDLAAKATNELAVDLHRQLATGGDNLCVSPYSIESALAMTFAGADGETRTEMARVLHFGNDAGVPASFAAL
jgi:serpin B